MELTNSQNLVVNSKDKSLLISASAGSGKTFVVIERIIKSIKDGTDVSSLLVLTFTNAAASELKERLISKLNDVKQEYFDAGDMLNARRIANQIAKVPMADVSTIHSFCLNIIRNNFYVLEIDPLVSTLDATKATIMLCEIIDECIEEEYELREEAFLDVLDIVGGEEVLVETLFTLYNEYTKIISRNEWLEKSIQTCSLNPGTDLANTDFGKVILAGVKDKLTLLKEELENTIDSLVGIDEFETRKALLELMLKKINKALTFKLYDELYEYMYELLDLPRFPSTKVTDHELNDSLKDLKERVVTEFKGLKKILYRDSLGVIEELNSSKKYIHWYTKLVKRIDEKYSLKKKEKSSIDFSDYERLALKALEDENVVSKYKEKYAEIYIDEYQDTSYAQEAIISKIAKENNVIRVGDVKQSIYGFRNAKPELFTNKYLELEEVESLEDNKIQGKIILAENFRSRKEVLDSTNDIFSILMTSEFGGSDYGEKEKLKYGNGYPESIDDTYKTEINVLQKEQDEDDAKNEYLEEISSIEKEAFVVAKRIQALIASNFQVYDLKKKEYRDCEYKDIVILLRTTQNKANVVSDVLSRAGIPAYADGKAGFYKAEEIGLVMSFLKVLNNPLDDINLVSIMYSIFGKFTLDELAKIRCENSSKPIIELLQDLSKSWAECEIKNKINSFLELIEKYRKYTSIYKVSDILIKLYNETGIYLAFRSETLGDIKCANIDSFVKVVEAFENSENNCTLYTLIKYLDVLKKKESSQDSPKLIGENENVVRIMTMHKSKGLEFPIVILMDTNRQYNERETKDKLQFDETLGIGLDIYEKSLGITYPSIIKQAIKIKTKKDLRAEALRLLYVACTRAKEKLIIYGLVNDLDKLENKLTLSEYKKLSVSAAQDHNTHFKCVLRAALNKQDNFILNIYGVSEHININKDTKINRNINKFDVLNKKIRQENIKIKKDELMALKDSFINQEYLDIDEKYTVSELKKKEETGLTELKPTCIENKVTSTTYGTFVHLVIQSIDYSSLTEEHIKEVVNSKIDELELQGKINKAKVIKDILCMLKALKDILVDAKTIKNELEFVIRSKLEGMLENPFEETTLIQGVVDMYVVTKDNKHIVIDFKTDRVEREDELKERYALQLKLYKHAMEISYNVKVSNTYIYSFALNKLIEVG